MNPARLLATLFWTLSGLDAPAFSVGGGSGMQEEGMEDVRLFLPRARVLGRIFGLFQIASTFPHSSCLVLHLGWMKKQRGERVKWRN